jgi:hypothetical protein
LFRGKRPENGQAAAHLATTSFVLDSGATHHVVNNQNLLATKQPTTISLRTADGQTMPVTASGKLKDFPGHALLVPSATENLLSVSQLTENGWKAEFDNETA